MMQARSPARRRRWPLILLAVLVLLGVGWIGVWYYGSGALERTIAGWQEREAKSGRIYNCASQTISGFPFGIDVRCADPVADLKSNQPPLALKARDLRVSASIWQPTVLNTDIVGPLTVAEAGQSPAISASWRSARAQVHGLPTAPESTRVKLDQPVVTRPGTGDILFKAESADVNGRMVSGSVQNRPVIEVSVKFAAGAAPAWHPAAATPIDADITAVLRGLKDFAPRPWQDRLRELQASGGRIEITSARVQQRDTIAVARGALGLSPAGRLQGQLQLTVANLEQILPELGLDKMLSQQQASPQLNSAFGALDRLLPGLGNVARQNAGPALVAGISMMGQPAELEGKRAVTLPLKFDDGMVSLGPLQIGQMPALY